VKRLPQRWIATRYWPQADKLENVVVAVRAVSEGSTSDQAIGDALGLKRGKSYANRQGRYYRLATEILSFTKRIRKNVSSLTPLGRRLLGADETERKGILTTQVVLLPSFQAVLGIIASLGGKTSKRDLAAAIEQLANTTPKMADRRLRTVIAWLEYLGTAKEEDGAVTLLTLPTSLKKIEIFNPEVPVLPKPSDMRLFKEVMRRKKEASAVMRFEVDAAKLERANMAHERLRTLLADRIKGCNAWPLCNNLVDLAARIDSQDFIIEVKSAGGRILDQVRRGVSQLYEYRYLEDLPQAKLVLLIEKPFSGRNKWLMDYLIKDRGVYVIWDAAGDALFTTDEGRADLPFMR